MASKRKFNDHSEFPRFDPSNKLYCQQIKRQVYEAKDEFRGLITIVSGLSNLSNIYSFIHVNTSEHLGNTPITAIRKVKEQITYISDNEQPVEFDKQMACIFQMAIEASVIIASVDSVVGDEGEKISQDVKAANDEGKDALQETIPQELQGVTPIDLRGDSESTQAMVVRDSNSINITISGDGLVNIVIPPTLQMAPIAQATLANLLNIPLVSEPGEEEQVEPNDEFITALETLYIDMSGTISDYIQQMVINQNRIGAMLSCTLVFAFRIIRFLVKYLWLINNRFHIVGCALSSSLKIFKLLISWIGYIVYTLLNSFWGTVFLFLLYLYFAWTCPECNDFILQCIWLVGKIPILGTGPVLNEVYEKIFSVVSKQIVITMGAVVTPFIAMYLSINETVTSAGSTVVNTVDEITTSEIIYNMLYIPLFVAEDNLRLTVDPQYASRRKYLLFLLYAMGGNVTVIDNPQLNQIAAPIPTMENVTTTVTHFTGSERPSGNITAQQILSNYIFNLTNNLRINEELKDVIEGVLNSDFEPSEFSYDAIVDNILLANRISVSRTFESEIEGYINSPILSRSIQTNITNIVRPGEIDFRNVVSVIIEKMKYIIPAYIGLTQNVQIPGLTYALPSPTDMQTIQPVISTQITPSQTIVTAFSGFRQIFSDVIFGTGIVSGLDMISRVKLIGSLFMGDSRQYFELFNRRVNEVRDLDFQNVSSCPTITFEELDGGSKRKTTKKKSKSGRSIKRNKKSNRNRSVYKSRRNKKHKKHSFRKSKRSMR